MSVGSQVPSHPSGGVYTSSVGASLDAYVSTTGRHPGHPSAGPCLANEADPETRRPQNPLSRVVSAIGFVIRSFKDDFYVYKKEKEKRRPLYKTRVY